MQLEDQGHRVIFISTEQMALVPVNIRADEEFAPQKCSTPVKERQVPFDVYPGASE